MSFDNEGGFTRGDFLAAVRSGYSQIYAGELETTSVAEGRLAPGFANRNKTNGTYQLWGHDLGDLSLDDAYKEEGVWKLGISS
jgi:hypothetical protein